MSNKYLKLTPDSRFPLLYEFFEKFIDKEDESFVKKIHVKKWKTQEYNNYQFYKPISKIIPLEDD